MAKKGRKGLDPELVEKIRNLYKMGVPARIIAERLNIGVSTVYKYLGKRAGLLWKLKRKFGRK